MTTQCPIHPPIELVREVWDRLRKAPDSGTSAAIAWTEAVARAAQWGADQELEACCEWMRNQHLVTFNDRIPALRAARRPKPPKPPSLKEQALEALSEMEDECLMVTYAATIRRALESLPDNATH